MYKFIKKKCGRTGIIDKWMLECDSAEVLQEHHEKIFSSVIEDGIKDVFSRGNEMRHLTTDYGGAINTLADIRGDSLFNSSIELEQRITASKLKMLMKFGCILLRENGSYTVHSDEDEIVETMLSKELAYPNYTLEDIRLKQWQGGNHWYAYIGNLSVSMNGESKWNTQSYAQQMAEEYFNTYIKEK